MKIANILTGLLFLSVMSAFSAQKLPLADPFILYHDNTYYAYGTSDANGIVVYTSTNLHFWKKQSNLALHKNNSYADRWFWAPEVYCINGRFYMYYSADEHICVATSDSPLGPFVQDVKEPMLPDKAIDHSLFIDDDGKPYLFFVRFTDGNAIWMAELENDYKTIKTNTMKLCFAANTSGWEADMGKVSEGPFVLKNNGYYYLTYSANHFESQNYGVGFAYTSNLAGSWTKYSGNPILQKPNGLFGSGHHCLFRDKDNNLKMAFHAHRSATSVSPRETYITSVGFTNPPRGLNILTAGAYYQPLYIDDGSLDNYDVTIFSLLDEMVSYEAAALYPNFICRQQSSYDRRSVTPGVTNWFANDDGGGFIRTETNNGRTEKVLFEDTGAGAITRIWMTTFDRSGTLRFYFDENRNAGWTINAYDMLQAGLGLGTGWCQPHINNENGGKGGSSFFFPITYAQACKVTLEEPSPTFSTPRYYQFNYRKYPAGTKVEPFTPAVATTLAPEIQSVNYQLLNPPVFVGGDFTNNTKQLAAGDSLKIILPAGTNIVRRLQVLLSNYNSEYYPQLMRALVLKAAFDGVQTVWAPLSDFSGGGMGAPSVASWYLTSDGHGSIESRWAMPYQNHAEITLVNYSEQTVKVDLRANTNNYTWRANSLYFHTSWRQQNEIPLTNQWENCFDWNFATLNGRGVYCGDVLSLFNHSPRWYGEGDEKIYVDNETFPSHFGTGTEDYYNCSWAPVTPFQTPFGGAPRADDISSHGYNTFFRTRNLDAIPFAEKLKFDIEMLSWDPGMADYATTVFWYGDIEATAEGLSDEEEATRELPPTPPTAFDYVIPNSFEFEELTFVEKSSNIRTEIQTMTPFQGKWSKAKQLLCRDAQVGDYLLYRFAGYEPAKRYKIQIQGTKAVDFGILGFSVNGGSEQSVDFYNNGVIHTGVISLGSRNTPDAAGNFELKIRYIGRNVASTGNLIGLDCIQIMEADFEVPGAIEFETYNFTNILGFTNNFAQEMGAYPNGNWSKKTQRVFQGGKTGDYIAYRFGNLEALENYKITLYSTKGPDFARLTFSVNGEILPLKFDGFHELVHDAGGIKLGVFTADSQGAIDFCVHVTGTNPYSYYPYYIVGLDCILFEKQAGSSLKTLSDASGLTIYIQGRQLQVEGANIQNVSLYTLSGMLAERKENEPFAFILSDSGCYLAVINYENNLRKTVKIMI